jgi:peptidase C39-like protein
MAVAALPSAQPKSGVPIKFGRFKRFHPRLNMMRIRILHALYRGGNHLLADDDVMNVVFGKIGDESDLIYNERRRRAFYENLMALVVNQISAGLAQDPCRLAQNKTGDAEAIEQPDEYWSELMENATVMDDDGSEQRSFDQILRDTCVEALVCGWAWAQVDLPAPDPDVEPPRSAAEEEEQDALRAYVITWPTDTVTDWEESRGKLVWLRTYECITSSPTPDAPRWPDRGGVRVHRWTIWTANDWTRYEVQETEEKPLSAWNDETPVTPCANGDHSFERVPWIRFDLCTPGTYLHVGDLVESLCRSYFNRTNGESWQWTQTCFQQLYEFLAPEMAGIDTPISQAQQDPGRATRQRRAPGVVHVRGENDKAMFVAPDQSGADSGQQATQNLRDAILRMTAQMALAQDTSGAMLRRSADSKQQDSVPTEIILGAVGKRLLIAAKQLVRLLALGRAGDLTPEEPPDLQGYERFDLDDASSLIQDSVLLAQVEIPSARYKIEAAFRVAVAHLGDNADPEVLAEIRDQLESAITQDQIENPPMPPGFGDDEETDPDEDDDSDSDGPPTPPPPPPPNVSAGAMQKVPGGKGAVAKKPDPAPGHQEKSWSCGPRAVVDALAVLGIDVEESRVRALSDADKDGTDEKQLIDALTYLGASTEIYNAGSHDQSWNRLLESVGEDGHPCIICCDNWDHWCTVIGVTGGLVVMQDPSNEKDNVAVNGVHVLNKAQLAKRWRCRGAEKSFYMIIVSRSATK